MSPRKVIRTSPLSGFVPPMLPTLVDEPPSGEQWLHEIKHDGYRTQLHVIPGGQSRAYTRNGHDWSDRYCCVLKAAEAVLDSPAVLDGEMIVQDESGRSDFHSLKGCISSEPERLVFYAFDLLSIGERELRSRSLLERKAELQSLIGPHQADCCIQYTEHVPGDGAAMFGVAEEWDLEGMVSKKASSRYVSGRTRSWLKTKTFAVSEFLVVGYEVGDGPALALLARHAGSELEYAGFAFVTLSAAERELFWRTMEGSAREAPPLSIRTNSKARWVEPKLMVQVKHLRGEHRLRHATLCGVLPRGEQDLARRCT